MRPVRVTVVGSGVIGLTTAVVLAERGCSVHVVARDLPPNTTSDVAAALWFPYLAEPRERVARWAGASYERFVELAADPATGVTLRDTIECFDGPRCAPEWRAGTRGLRAARADEVPPGSREAWFSRLPVARMPTYLPWLAARATALGVTREVRTLGTLAELRDTDVIVNCSGLGARELARDPSLVPVRGQVVRVQAPAITRVLVDDSDENAPLYVVPRGEDCVVGGTAERGVADLAVDPAATARILARAAAKIPALRHARVVGAAVGLRPVRPTVRVEIDGSVASPTTIHAYGHGGAGMTLSWGCAFEVAGWIPHRRP